jgi:threonine dehydrogenase-like Zn-dependent dehydrogenase
MVYTRPGVVEIQDVDEPVAGPGEVIIDVAAAGICGSELHGISKPGFRTPPLVMGHEFAGTTPDGRPVVVNPIVSCGSCDLCDHGLAHVCRERSIVGIHRPGGFAERVVVPERMLHALPVGTSWEVAAMIEPLANAIHAWNLAGSPSGARVGVIGAGTIGLVSLLATTMGGAGEVVVTDLAEDRLEIARALGASSTGPALDGEFDVVIDAVGLAATHQASIQHLRPGGTTVWIGLMGTEPGFDATELIRQEKRVLGSFAYSDDEFGIAVEAAPRCDLSWVSSYPLAEGPGIFTELMNGRSDVIKALLHPAHA